MTADYQAGEPRLETRSTSWAENGDKVELGDYPDEEDPENE